MKFGDWCVWWISEREGKDQWTAWMDGRERGGFESLADFLDMAPCDVIQVVLARGRIALLMLHSPLHDVLVELLFEGDLLAREAAFRVAPVH